MTNEEKLYIDGLEHLFNKMIDNFRSGKYTIVDYNSGIDGNKEYFNVNFVAKGKVYIKRRNK